MRASLEVALAALPVGVDSQSWKPLHFMAHDTGQVAALERLVRAGRVLSWHDTLQTQLEELLETRHPANDLTVDDKKRLVLQHLGNRPLETYGCWVFYPWTGRLVRVLPEAEFRELRTSRNKNKITAEEQELLLGKRIGVVGLSVGQAAALTLAMEQVGGEFVLADFDELGLSNLNRVRSGVHNLGVNKALLTAREIFELDPWARIEVFPQGLREEQVDSFLSAPRRLDLLIEECDDFYIKVKVRERARALRIPVLMETSDRGLLDLERFDLEPDRPLLHGLIEGLDLARFKSLSSLEKIPTALELVGGVNVSARMAASLVEVKQTLKTWPQLASAVALAGATSTDAARRLLLGQLPCSGRFYVDLERLVAPDAAAPVAAPIRSGDVSPQAKTARSSPGVQRSSGTLTMEQVRTLVHFGTMAPSGGNCQPWRFRFARGRLECFHEPERSKSFLDYSHLASFVAFGGCVENMELVAAQQGLAVKTEAFPDGPEGPVCRLEFRQGRGDADQTLFEQIARRLTNRKPGQREPLSAATASGLNAAADARGARLRLIDDQPGFAAMADILGPGDRMRFVSKLMHGELMAEIRWSRAEVERTKDGLDVATLELGAVDLAGLRLATSMGAMELVGRLGGGRALEKPTRNSIAGASAMGLLTIPGGHTPRAMFAGGRALQRLWLTATSQGYWLQPMTALVCLFWRLLDGAPGLTKDQANLLHSLRQKYQTVFDVSATEGEVMLFRLTRADAPSAHSLRRPVDEVLSFAPEL